MKTTIITMGAVLLLLSCMSSASTLRDCSLSFCTLRGPNTACRASDVYRHVSCGFYGAELDLGRRACDALTGTCPSTCSSSRPVDTSGRQHCTFCHLMIVSCKSFYSIYYRSTRPPTGGGDPNPPGPVRMVARNSRRSQEHFRRLTRQ